LTLLKVTHINFSELGLLRETILLHRSGLVLSFLLLMLESGLMLLSPWIAGHFTSGLLGDGIAFGVSLEKLLCLWFLILLLQAIIRYANQLQLGVIGVAISTSLRQRVYGFLQLLPLSWHENRKRGEILSYLVKDIEAVSTFISGPLVHLLPQLFIFCGALILVLKIDNDIGLLIVLLMPLLFLLLKLLGRRLRNLARQRIEQYASLYGVASENLELMPLIKSFSRESIEEDRYAVHNNLLAETTKAYLKRQLLLAPLVRFVGASGILFLLFLGVGSVQSQELDAGRLVTVLLYGMLMTLPLSSIASGYGEFQSLRGATERLVNLFAVDPEPRYHSGVDDMDSDAMDVQGNIQFKNVDFAYPGRQRLLQKFYLDIKLGETIAITGPNGCGKSTLVHLLMRFLSLDSGQILIDGKDINTYPLDKLRRSIGLVQQHVLLMNSTVKDNILVGNPLADDKALWTAIRQSHADEFIQALPAQLETVIGDQGVRLSGGQRQRLALARALLRDPPILILDEATSMFDPSGEHQFIEECKEVLGDKTVIIITHREASLALADRVIELELG
jgi:ATP-binding cassette subfamily B protein